MLKYVDYKVTFSEVPDEISLCINLSGCPHKCEGCHSPYLQEDIGEELNTEVLTKLIKENEGITCVCFMGGDNDIPYLSWMADFHPTMDRPICKSFDFIKIGPYIERYGPLTNPNTNQRFYTKGSAMKKMDANPHMWYDTTDKFWADDTDS